MMRNLSIHLSILSLALVIICFTGCLSPSNDSSRVRQQAESSPDPQPSAQGANDDTYFRIFDMDYDFTRSIENDYRVARQRFPVDSDVQVAEISGPAILAERLHLVDTAERSIRIQSLTFWADEGGWEITDRLIAATKRGVDVHIILDPLTNIGLQTQKMFFELQQHDIRIEGFEFGWLSSWSGYGTAESFWQRARKLNQRFHEKMFVRDGETADRALAIVGGSNLAKAYFQIDRENPANVWRDQDLLLHGEAAVTIREQFDDNLQKYIDFKRTHGVNADKVWDFLIKRAKDRGEETVWDVPRLEADPVIRATIDEYIAARSAPELVRAERVRTIMNRPRLQEFFIQDALFDMIESAKTSIDIANAYVIPDDATIELLHAAVRRGVEVRILTNSAEASDLDSLNVLPTASRATYEDLLAINDEERLSARLSIYEWQGHDVLENNIGHMHSKFAIFDDRAVMIGSYNLDPRSATSNSENASFVLGTEVAATFQDLFNQDISQDFSREITREDAIGFRQSEGFLARMRERLVRWVGPFL